MATALLISGMPSLFMLFIKPMHYKLFHEHKNVTQFLLHSPDLCIFVFINHAVLYAYIIIYNFVHNCVQFIT